MSKVDRQMTPIAVVGVSALFPGSSDARGFWADIMAGRDLITDVPPTEIVMSCCMPRETSVTNAGRPVK